MERFPVIDHWILQMGHTETIVPERNQRYLKNVMRFLIFSSLVALLCGGCKLFKPDCGDCPKFEANSGEQIIIPRQQGPLSQAIPVLPGTEPAAGYARLIPHVPESLNVNRL